MSQNIHNPASVLDSFVKVLTDANALIPAAVPGIAAIVGIFKSGIKAGKSPEEIEAEAVDSMATALRTRAKSEAQESDNP